MFAALIFVAMYNQVNIDDGFLNLMNQDGVSKDDVRVPEGDIGKGIQADFDDGKDLLVTILTAMNEEAVRAPNCAVLRCH
jgi:translation initiation factor 5A